MGDFNSHHTLWGSSTIDARGRTLEHFINGNDLVILNTGEGTYLHSRSRTLSAIDLTFSTPSLAPILRWSVLENHHDTDHLPVMIEFAKIAANQNQTQRWQLERADWTLYQDNIQNFYFTDDNIDNMVTTLTNAIIAATESAVPQTKNFSRPRTVPWWNNLVAKAIAEKKHAFNVFKRHPSESNLINFKRLRAKARKIILKSKQNSWKGFVSSITHKTPITEVWRKIRFISGKQFSTPSPALLVDNEEVTDPFEVVNELDNHFKSTSSSQNYTNIFQELQAATERELDFDTHLNLPYNTSFSMKELEEALSSCTNSSPGPDKVPYEFIRQLPENQKRNLLALYNKIWSKGKYQKQWKEALIIPLLKQDKNPILSSSYRPISLTCCLGKILENMVCARLTWIIESKKLLSTHQTGSRKARSTLDNLVHIEDSI